MSPKQIRPEIANYAAAITRHDHASAVLILAQLIADGDIELAAKIHEAALSAATASHGTVHLEQVIDEVPAGTTVIGFKLG